MSDNLHARVHKDFSKQEDFGVELEYHINDDMSVRGIKDERGDIGGEVEMRWKF